MNQIISILAVFLCLLSTISGAAKESVIPPTIIETLAEKAQKPIMEAGMYEDTFTSSANRKIYYTLRIPEKMTENMPIIVWLHGANGMTGTWVQNHKGVAIAADNLNEERFIILQPQSYGNWFERYTYDAIVELIDAVAEKTCTGSRNIILCGSSMGGVGVYAMGQYDAADKTGIFAGLCPVSGTCYLDIDDLLRSSVPIYSMYAEYDGYDVKQSMEAVAKRLDGVHHDNMIKCFENTHHEAMAVLPFDEAFFDWAYEAYRNACKAATATDE